MTIQSMTGFGKAEAENENFLLTVELKAVNNRFKDYRFKMGSVFNSMEVKLKKQLENAFSRGSFEVSINYKKSQKAREVFELDTEKIQNYLTQIKGLLPAGEKLNVQPTEFLRGDFYQEDDSKDEELQQMLERIFGNAIEKLTESRQEEGQKLVEKLRFHKAEYEKYYQDIFQYKESYQEAVKDKLKKRFENVSSELPIDEPRFLQEVIYYLEKLDIDEELTRIKIHLEKLEKILLGTEDVGRQIDFLVQELNRETNTVGSKSGHQQISENVVQMKVQLEKIREQALNLQ